MAKNRTGAKQENKRVEEMYNEEKRVNEGEKLGRLTQGEAGKKERESLVIFKPPHVKNETLHGRKASMGMGCTKAG